MYAASSLPDSHGRVRRLKKACLDIPDVMVPVERIELPTFGLQNRCSTAELNRRIEAIGEGRNIPPLGPIFGGSNIRLVRKGPEPQEPLSSLPHGKRRPIRPPFPNAIRESPTGRDASGRPRRGTRCRGCRQSRCGGRSRRRRSGRWRWQPPCRPRRRRRRPRHRPARSRCHRPSGCSCFASAVLIGAVPIGLIAIGLTLVAAGIGVSRSPVLAIGVWIELRAIAGIVDDFLRHRGAGERGGKDRRGGEEFRILSSWYSVADECRAKRARGRSFRCGLFRPSQTSVMPQSPRDRASMKPVR